MRRENPILLFVVLLVLVPGAQAGDPVDVGVEGGRGECGSRDAGVDCVATRENDGSWDVEQRNVSVQVRVHDEFWDTAGLPAPPLEPLHGNGSDIVVPHPVLGMVESVLDGRTADHPLSAWAGANLSPEAYDYWYYGPSLKDPEDGLGTRYGLVTFGEDWVAHDQIGPFHRIGNSTTHDAETQYILFTCHMTHLPGCEETLIALQAEGDSRVPTVAFGFDFDDVRVTPAGDAGTLVLDGNRSSASGPLERGASGALVAQLQSAPPQRPLSIEPAFRFLPPLTPPGPRGHSELPARVEGNPRAFPFPSSETAAMLAIGTGLSLLLIFAALYTRIHRREEALRSERRQRLIDILASKGPQTIAALSRELGLDRTTVEHHARVLQRTGQTVMLREARFVYIALPGQSIGNHAKPPRPTEAQLLRVLEASGGQLERDALATLTPAMAQRSRNHALGELVKRGTLRVDWDGYTQTVKLT